MPKAKITPQPPIDSDVPCNRVLVANAGRRKPERISVVLVGAPQIIIVGTKARAFWSMILDRDGEENTHGSEKKS